MDRRPSYDAWPDLAMASDHCRGVLDVVVANQGSNNISVLLGERQGENWTLMNGAALRAGNAPAEMNSATAEASTALQSGSCCGS